MRKPLLIFVALLAALGVIAASIVGPGAWRMAAIGASVKAKLLCSGVFVSGRTAEVVTRDDLLPELELVDATVDQEARQVVATALGGWIERVASFRDRRGCVLEAGQAGDTTLQPRATTARPAVADLPSGANDPGVDHARIGRALDEVFSEPDPERRRDTRAVVVLHRGRLIAERYAQGFDASTAQHGWSMTKSLLNALIGIRIGQGHLDLADSALLPEWDFPDDPRAAITLDQLMRMSSGLDFREVYDDLLSDVVLMLFEAPDAGGFAAQRPLAVPPDARWAYSSGTSNLVSRILRRSFDRDVDYADFPQTALFDRLGMGGAVIELDAAGAFVASSFGYATARDWARFGQLYLNDGIWDGERLLPEGWVAYSTTPTPGAPTGNYGAHFWLNAGDPQAPDRRRFPRLPRDLFYAAGFDEQYVFIIPSADTVVVRLGRTPDASAWDPEAMLVEILASLVAGE